MRTISTALAGASLLLVTAAGDAWGQRAQDGRGREAIETRIWMDRGVDPVFRPGDRARIYYRTSRDAYVALFHLDTDGVLRLLYPSSPDQPHRVRGGRDYRLLFGEATDWRVDDAPGVGYFFAFASEVPLDFGDPSLSTRPAEWSTLSLVGTQTREDPFVVLNAMAGALLPRGAQPGAVGVDLAAYHVGQSYSYPRFLCYGCHTPQPFESWNPYQVACPSYRVVIYNDPYFYPATRYQAGRPVYTIPPDPGAAQFAFKARAPGESGAPLVQGRLAGAPSDPAAGTLIPRSAPEAIQLRGTFPTPPIGAPVPEGTQDPRIPPVMDPVVERRDTPEGRPVLQRRTSDTAEPPPR